VKADAAFIGRTTIIDYNYFIIKVNSCCAMIEGVFIFDEIFILKYKKCV